MSYMLREESFHMGTGNDGLRRIVQAGKIPAWLIQKYLNKWISCSYDLFGTDHSSSAHWAYVWGVKGRYDEPKNEKEADLDDINDYNRVLYHDEVAGLIARLNTALAAGVDPLYAPDIRFNRNIGKWRAEVTRKTASRSRSASMPIACTTSCRPPRIRRPCLRSSPMKRTDRAEGRWRDPLETIGEVRRSAINL